MQTIFLDNDKGKRRHTVDWTHVVIIAIVGATAIGQSISIAILSRDSRYVASIGENTLNKVE